MIRTAALKNWTVHLHGQGISLLLAFSLIAGLLYGVLMVRADTQFAGQLLSFASGWAGHTQTPSVLSAFFETFLSLFCFLLLPYLCGFCAIGQIGACFSLFTKALGIGAFLGGLYMQYRWQGVGYCAVAVIPPAVLSVFTLMLACRESIRLSNRMFAAVICGAEGGIGLSAIRLYHIKYLIICLFALGSSLIEALFSVWFAGMLELT